MSEPIPLALTDDTPFPSASSRRATTGSGGAGTTPVHTVEILRVDQTGHTQTTAEEQLLSPTGSVVSRTSSKDSATSLDPSVPPDGSCRSSRSSSITKVNGRITSMRFNPLGSATSSSSRPTSVESSGNEEKKEGINGASIHHSMRGTTTARTAAALADNDRLAACHPGRHTYSAKMDRAALECWYKLFCVCGENRTKAVRRSFIDVYSNGVVVNAPRACCCMTPTDNATLRYWDDPRVAHIGKGGWCSPVPWLFPHCCNCCGETLFFNQCCGCPNGFGHCTLCVPPCFCSTDMFLGLEEGEAQRLAVSLNGARDRYAISNPLTRIMGM